MDGWMDVTFVFFASFLMMNGRARNRPSMSVAWKIVCI